MASLSMRARCSIALLGSAVAWGGVAGCMKDDATVTATSCVINAEMPCNTVLAGDKDAGVPLGLVGYTCQGTDRPDQYAKYIHGIPFGQICASQANAGEYCCTSEDDLANCAYNPTAICPDDDGDGPGKATGYQCWGPNRPEVNNAAITCGNGVREGNWVNYCCHSQPRPVGCTQAKGAFGCTGGLIGWVCPEGFRPRGEDFGANESRADYYYFVCGVPTPAPNPDYSTYCCFTPSPVLPGGSCVYNPGITKTIPDVRAWEVRVRVLRTRHPQPELPANPLPQPSGRGHQRRWLPGKALLLRLRSAGRGQRDRQRARRGVDVS